MKNKDSIDVLVAQLYAFKVAYSWEHKGWGGKYDHLALWGLSIFASYALFGFFWFVFDDFSVDSIEFWGIFTFATMMALVSRYLFFPDKHRCYHLTSLGIHYKEQDIIPEVAYKIVRGFAWVGIAVCIIAAFLVGPLAFAGAGAFALTSFGMTNFRPTLDKSYVLIDERSVAFDLINNVVISFVIPEKGMHAFSGDVYISTLKQKEELLSHLKSMFPHMEIVKIKRLNHQYKHPVYNQDEDATAE